jgi:RNA polymerase sigma factor (TIGR02999 family)
LDTLEQNPAIEYGVLQNQSAFSLARTPKRFRKTAMKTPVAARGAEMGSAALDGSPGGNEASLSLDAIYEELRRIAHGWMGYRPSEELSLGPTGLVHLAVVRLLESPNLRGRTDRDYLLGAALRAMRRILVDRSRERRRLKRGGKWRRVPLDPLLDYFEAQKIDVLDLREAIDRLGRLDPRQADMVTMRYYLGMTHAQIGQQTGLSEATVERDLRLARAWLRRELGRGMREQ